MSVIVYKDGAIYADSGAVEGPVWAAASTVKIATNANGDVAGGTGYLQKLNHFLDWVRQGAVFPYASRNDVNDWDAILIKANPATASAPTIYLFDAQGYVEITGPYIALGSGRLCALGALHMGASPQQAIEACFEHAVACRGPVQMLNLRRAITQAPTVLPPLSASVNSLTVHLKVKTSFEVDMEPDQGSVPLAEAPTSASLIKTSTSADQQTKSDATVPHHLDPVTIGYPGTTTVKPKRKKRP